MTTLTIASPVTIGTSSLGGSVPDGGAPVSPTPTEVELATAMLGAGVPVDTSNAYAAGRSEAVLGAAIRQLGGLPDGVQVLSKADSEPGTGTFDRDRVWRSFEESTSRLGLERLPLYQLHDPYTVTFAEAMGPQGAVAGLLELREQGLVGAIGVAAGPVALLTEYVRTGAFDVLLTHNRYTLVDRSAADLIEECAGAGMTVLNAAPFGGGLLADGSTNTSRYSYRPAPAELLSWVDRLDEVCARHGVSRGAVALQFSIRNPAIASTVVGISSQARLAALESLERAEIPEELWQQVVELGTPPSTNTD